MKAHYECVDCGLYFDTDMAETTADQLKIDDTKVLHGTVGKKNERWAWTVWETIDLGVVELKDGENTIEIRNINKSSYALVDIDCFNIFY